MIVSPPLGVRRRRTFTGSATIEKVRRERPLIALSAVVFLFLAVRRAQQTVPLGPGEIAAAIITGLLFAGTIAAGGLLSLGKPMPGTVVWMHRLFPYLTVLSSAVTLYLANA